MELGLKIRCPNKRRNSKNPQRRCGWPLLFISEPLVDRTILIDCKSCGAQVQLEFNDNGSLTAEVLQRKLYIDFDNYPCFATGKYEKKRIKPWQQQPDPSQEQNLT